jgi:hypothetical protein
MLRKNEAKAEWCYFQKNSIEPIQFTRKHTRAALSELISGNMEHTGLLVFWRAAARTRLRVETFQLIEKSAQDKTAGIGGMVWPVAHALVGHLDDPQYFPRSFWDGKVCLELGAGTGIVGLCAAALGARVHLTDIGAHVQLLHDNATLATSGKHAIDATLVSVGEYRWCVLVLRYVLSS